MKKCNLLSNLIADEMLLTWSTPPLSLKAQKIISVIDGDISLLGYELLLNPLLKHENNIEEYNRFILNGYALDYTLNYIKTSLLNKKIECGIKIFINVERANLCNKVTLRKIAASSNILYKRYDIELVVEITERNICGFCSSISEGLLFLVKNKVSLAVDDFDIYSDKDFRKNEVNMGLYNYIKIEMPSTPNQLIQLNRFTKDNKTKKIIIERIEDEIQFGSINKEYVYAVQGFLFDRGSSLA